MPPSAPGSQGQRQHSGRRADTAANTGSTLASVTMPAPEMCIRDSSYPMEVVSYTRGRGHLNLTLDGYRPCHNAA